MKHIFYFLAVFPVLWEMLSVMNIKKVHTFMNKLKSNKDHKSYTDTQKTLSFFLIGYVVWVFVGLFTFQWPIFLFIFLISLIPKQNIVVRWIDAFVTFVILIFAILNTYHFKIDVFQLILQTF